MPSAKWLPFRFGLILIKKKGKELCSHWVKVCIRIWLVKYCSSWWSHVQKTIVTIIPHRYFYIFWTRKYDNYSDYVYKIWNRILRFDILYFIASSSHVCSKQRVLVGKYCEYDLSVEMNHAGIAYFYPSLGLWYVPYLAVTVPGRDWSCY